MTQRTTDEILRDRDDAGVSAVIGAVLVFGLMSSAFIIWSFTTLPVWISDNEEARNQDVEQSFSTLKAGLDLLAADGSAGPISASFPLSADEVPLLQPVASVGRLYYEDGFGWDGSFTNAVTHMVDGVFASPTQAVGGSSPLTDVDRMVGLTLSLSMSAGDTVVLTAADGSNTVTGTVALLGGANCNGSELRFTVSSSITSTPRSTSQCGFDSTSISGHLFDPLDPGQKFSSELNRLTTPYGLTLTQTGGTSNFGAAWIDDDALIQVVPTGGTTSTVNRNVDGGRLVFEPVNLHYVEQDLVWEGGSILRSQPDGISVAIAPDFDMRIESTNGIGHLRWTVINVAGTGDVAGSGSAEAVMTYQGSDEQLLTAPSGSIILDTSYADGWVNFLESQILIAGADASTTVDEPATDQVRLQLHSGGGITEWRVHFRIMNASTIVGG